MKIGDEVYIHGYIDEIRKDTIIIKNDGGYFGTIPSEIIDKEQEPCEDDISRKAVLDTLDTADKFLDEDRTVERYKAILTDAYEVLPSVNPQVPKTEPCEDCVSREQAKAEIRKAFPSLADRVDINSILNELPSVQPKTGHWEWVQYDYNPKLGNWHCSECRRIVFECVCKEEEGGIPLYKYCPMCGAKLEVEE